MKKTPRGWNTTINAKSKKHKEIDPEYHKLIDKLRELCGNVSEMTGEYPDWSSSYDLGGYMIEPHHIGGRRGAKLTDPFGIVMLTGKEHRIEEGRENGIPFGKDKLYKKVRILRISQGFLPKPY